MYNYNILPEHMQGGMKRYIEDGIPPGGFLYAVLCNDLMGAVRKADDINQHRLIDYARFLYNEAPSNCYGSPQKVEAWIDAKQNETVST